MKSEDKIIISGLLLTFLAVILHRVWKKDKASLGNVAAPKPQPTFGPPPKVEETLDNWDLQQQRAQATASLN